MNRKPPASYGTMSSVPDVGFSENTIEFKTLCDNIVTNIYTINTSWKTLDGALKNIGTSKDNKSLRDKIHVTQLSANQIVNATTRDLHKLKILTQKGQKAQKLQAEKLMDNFKEAVAQYSSIQKEVLNKMRFHILSSPIEPEVTPIGDSEEQRMMQLSREIAFEQEMLLEREANIKQIEADILDVNEIMRELSSMVYEQREMTNAIETNVEDGAASIEEGTSQLQKAAQYQRRHRRRLCYLAIIGLIILIIIITVVVVEMKR